MGNCAGYCISDTAADKNKQVSLEDAYGGSEVGHIEA
jgi:hypothetical protein